MISLTACSTTKKVANTGTQNQYVYPYKCTKKGQVVDHAISSKVSLTADNLKKLISTLQQKFQLDYNSCEFVGDLNIINKSSLNKIEGNISNKNK